MNQKEYQKYYMDFITNVLIPSVKRGANCDLVLQGDQFFRCDYQNKLYGVIIIALISFTESRFFIKASFKALRNFKQSTDNFLKTINIEHLSCFVYIRDCFSHNPSGIIFDDGKENTKSFLKAVENNSFPWAKIRTNGDNRIIIDDLAIHELHLIIMELFQQKEKEELLPES